MATQITADLPTLDFPREVDYPTQEDWAAFSSAAEENFGILGGDWSTQMQLWKDQANAMSIESNNNADIAQAVANYQGDWLSKGYTLGQTVSIGQVYYICKLTHASGQNPTDVSSLYWNLALGNWNLKVDTNISGYASKSTPVDADLIPLSDSVSSFGIKKLSWANLKATLKTYFDTLYVALSGNQTIADIKTFTSSPRVPTPTDGDHVANKSYADLKVALAAFTGANVNLASNGYQKLPSGLIIQWGTVNAINTNGGYTTASYPIRFPNNCFQVVGARDALGENAVLLVGKAGGDPAGQVIVQNWGLSAEISKYVAIGY